MSNDNEIVGHKTFVDDNGKHRHEPLTKGEANELWAAVERDRDARAAVMPTAEDAVKALWEAQYRLEELGWKPSSQCPPDGKLRKMISLGSAGIHEVYCKERPASTSMGSSSGKWFWQPSKGDLWPYTPILYLPDAKP